MNIEKMEKYLNDTGLAERFTNLKPGDSFGVELPIDEENNKWLRFWLSTEGETEIKFMTFDFEGVISVRVCCDAHKVEEWRHNTGSMELSDLKIEVPETEKEEAKE